MPSRSSAYGVPRPWRPKRRAAASAASSGWPKWYLIPALVVVFLTFGVPRWLAGDVAPGGSHAGANLSKLCRDHGGTPTTAPPGAGTSPGAQGFCTVRYGRNVYRMDAITPAGFDADTARFQRQGCEEASREQRAASAHGGPRRSFVYHSTTGVCEHRS